MRTETRASLLGVGLAAFLFTDLAMAEDPTAGAMPPASDNDDEAKPPTLRTQTEATYPPDARRDTRSLCRPVTTRGHRRSPES